VIPRYQRIVFAILLGSSILMAGLLIWLHQRNFEAVKNADNTPIEAPVYSASEDVPLLLANDADGSVKTVTRSLALPQQTAVRARALLEHLLAEYTLPRSTHPIGGGVAVEDVYLVPLPLGAQTAASSLPAATLADIASGGKGGSTDALMQSPGLLAVVNLRSSWVEQHPPGITSETLTIQSIVGTLHANLPEITAVRFLVDGKPRATLAGSVEFDRTYDPLDTVK
jgi:hypothetical protein